MNRWYTSEGMDSDVAISTRIRLARNIKGFNFPSKISDEQRKSINKKVLACIKNSEVAPDFEMIDMNILDDAHAISMVERHIISPNFAKNRKNSSLILSHDESVSIMLCEEDHIRLQVMSAGLNLDGAYQIANTIDDMLDCRLNYAFDEKLGYLTSCPTNLGTAMKASVMLHLPALSLKGQIGPLASTVSKLGLTLRGAFGENTSAVADFFQLSNQITLGITEKNAIENLKSIVNQIVIQERNAREKLSKNELFEDSIHRAYGTLKHARLLSTKEFMKLISFVRLGISQDILDIQYETVGTLILKMQPATLMADANAKLSADLRDRLRAKLVRETLEK